MIEKHKFSDDDVSARPVDDEGLICLDVAYQPFIDLNKNDVIALAKALNVTEEDLKDIAK